MERHRSPNVQFKLTELSTQVKTVREANYQPIRI